MSKKLRVFYLLQVAYSAVFRAADHRARQNTGLTVTQIAVLFLLNEKDGQPVSEIANRLSMGKSSLTGLIDRMSEKRLVKRSPCPIDGRVTRVYLEETGRTAAQEAALHTQHYNAALLAPFTEDEQDVIGRFLHHLATNADTIINGPNAGQSTLPHMDQDKSAH
ncbi:MarR family winged helix-turn-helix transcriptional regulator [Roseibium alexandrii]|uniref:HTH-type transcriptional regulator MhqR n=1 Tax=Roseibium alexandrii TaxID=388408 RepID=A0A0M6ZQH0_9HYPH|nr:MarR family transcriptional regulator [Roseibium alexandrii]CTQ63673.1 HTH-type transcriptional regulator MhqR [Roseibium alexandrii]